MMFARYSRWALACVVTLGLGSLGHAQMPSQEAIEAKRKENEAKRAAIAKMRASRATETPEQRDERLRNQAKMARQSQALAAAQAGLRFASRRQNRSALLKFIEAWRLDPTNMDYSYNAAQFAEGVNDPKEEFLAYTRYMNVAKDNFAKLPAGPSTMRSAIETRMAKATKRLEVLRKTQPSGKIRIITTPPSCEVFLDDHMMGVGGGVLETLTGQHQVRTECLGYRPLAQVVNVRVGDMTTAKLNPQPVAYFGFLQLNVTPADGVTIFLDDVPLDKRLGGKATEQGKISGSGTKTDPYQMHARKWVIRFKKDGYDRWHRRIEIKRDRIIPLNVKLEKMGETIGRQCK